MFHSFAGLYQYRTVVLNLWASVSMWVSVLVFLWQDYASHCQQILQQLLSNYS